MYAGLMARSFHSFALASVALALSCQSSDVEFETDRPFESDYTTAGVCDDGLPKLDVVTPPGVCVSVVAGSAMLAFPRSLAQLPNGDVWVTDMGGWGKDLGAIVRIRKSPAGKYITERVLTGIDKPSGIAVNPKDGLIYVGTPKDIFRFNPAETKPRLTVVIDNMPDVGRHPLKHFVFDGQTPDVLYVNMGSFSDVCEQPSGSFPSPCTEELGTSSRASIRKYILTGPDRKASSFTTVASGLRNSMALAIHPVSNLLIQGENARDSINKRAPELTSRELELPHEELNVIEQGAHYGFPYCYDNGVPSPEYSGANCMLYKNPALLLPGHASPLGMEFYPGVGSARTKMFPPAYQGNLIVSYHGYRENGHRIVMVPVDAQGRPGIGAPLDLVRGWEANAAKKNPTGAPVDILIANDGSIWTAEDKNRSILRISYNPRKGSGAPMPALPPKQPVITPEEAARCATLRTKSDLFSSVQRDVLDTNCVSCHGAGPGFPGNLAILRCDDVGNAKRFLEARKNAGPLVLPSNLNSELLLRIKGQGFPQMPAGGLSPEALKEVEDWIVAGAPAPR
jgi:glucose/arabinose dehydrogenase